MGISVPGGQNCLYLLKGLSKAYKFVTIQHSCISTPSGRKTASKWEWSKTVSPQVNFWVLSGQFSHRGFGNQPGGLYTSLVHSIVRIWSYWGAFYHCWLKSYLHFPKKCHFGYFCVLTSNFALDFLNSY